MKNFINCLVKTRYYREKIFFQKDGIVCMISAKIGKLFGTKDDNLLIIGDIEKENLMLFFLKLQTKGQLDGGYR